MIGRRIFQGALLTFLVFASLAFALSQTQTVHPQGGQANPDPLVLDCPEFQPLQGTWYWTKYNCGAEGQQFFHEDAQHPEYITGGIVWTTQNDNTLILEYHLKPYQTPSASDIGFFDIYGSSARQAVRIEYTPHYCNALTGCVNGQFLPQGQPNWINNWMSVTIYRGNSCDQYRAYPATWRRNWFPSNAAEQTFSIDTKEGDIYYDSNSMTNIHTDFEAGDSCISLGVYASDQSTGRWYSAQGMIHFEE